MGDFRSEFQRHGYQQKSYPQQEKGRGEKSPPSGVCPEAEAQQEIKFRDEKGNLRRELLTTEAEGWAGDFVRPNDRRDKPLTSAQLRRFYNDVKALEARIDATGFEENKASVGMLRSKIAYAYGKENVPTVFKDFIKSGVEAIKNEQSCNFEQYFSFNFKK